MASQNPGPKIIKLCSDQSIAPTRIASIARDFARQSSSCGTRDTSPSRRKAVSVAPASP